MNSNIEKYGSISRKLLFLAVIPILIVSMLLGAYLISTRISDVNENLMKKGNLIAGNLSPSVEFGLFSQDVNFLKSLSEPLLSDKEVVSILILDKERKIVTASISPAYSASQLLVEESNSSVFESAVYSSRFSFTDTPENDLFEIDKIRAIEPELLGWVVVKLSKHAAEQRQTEIIINALLFIFLGVVISGFIAYRMSKRIAQPIESLTSTVAKMSSGNLNARSQIDGSGEIKLLQQGVNVMAEIVQKSQERLEQQVEHATQELTGIISKLEEKNTSLKSTQADLLTANAAKSEFLAKMSHEIRTPLTAVMGFSRLIESAKSKEDIRAYTRVINSSGVQLLNIIDDILSFSKLEEESAVTVFEDVNIRDTLDDMFSMLSPTAKAKKITLLSQVSNEIPMCLKGDVVKLSQIVINLVNNAIKFTEAGHVAVNVSLVDSFDEEVIIEFEVLDTGIGVVDKDSDSIFDSFSQAESEKNRSFGGTGLGLSISKKLVEFMGGEIGVDTTVKSGARFWAKIPMKLSNKIEDIYSFQGHDNKIVLYDKGEVSSQALSKLLLSWKADLYVCEDVQKMLELISLSNVEVDTIVLSLDFDESIPEFVAKLILKIEPRFTGKIVLLCSDNVLEISEKLSSSSVAVLEKPVPSQRLYYTLLPIADLSVKETNRAEAVISTTAKLPGKKARVLVAEDNEYNAFLIDELLSERRIECIKVIDADAVLQALEEDQFDLLLLDIHMPGMDGITLASEIRKYHYINEKTPIVAFTADVYVRNDEELHDKGVNDVLYKPLTDDSLDDMLATWLVGFDYDTRKGADISKPLANTISHRLLDDVLLHINNIESAYNSNREADLTMHIHQLEGVLGYFQFEPAFVKLGSIKISALSRDDTTFHGELSSLISIVESKSAELTEL